MLWPTVGGHARAQASNFDLVETTSNKSRWTRPPPRRRPRVRHPSQPRGRRRIALSVDASVVFDRREVEVIDLLEFSCGKPPNRLQGRNELLVSSLILEDEVPQHLVFRVQEIFQVCRGVARMARWVHDKTTGKSLAVFQLDVHGSWDSVRILAVVLRPAVLEGDFLHQSPSLRVVERVLAIVVRSEH